MVRVFRESEVKSLKALLALAVPLIAQHTPLPFNRELSLGDIHVILKDETAGHFIVGVRTSVLSHRAIVDVFYEEPGSESKQVGGIEPMFLHYQEAVAPIAGGGEYGYAHFEFRNGLLKERIRFVRVVLVQDVAKAELRF